MVIKNETKNTTLSDNAIEAKTFKQKALGLLSYPKPITIIFKTRFGIHTFFMKYSIDVLVLNKENKVAKIKESLVPNSIFVWNLKHETLIELPTKTLEHSKTQIGDQITFVNLL